MALLISDELIKRIADLRKAKKLHTEVENRLARIISEISSDYHPVQEPVGLAGGRNDLLVFEFSGKKVLFEIFATRSQVSRDLRILDKTKADKKVAIIIDKEVDKTVFAAFIKENPEDNYPFLFISEFFDEHQEICTLKIREIVLGDENAKFLRMLRTKLSAENFFSICKREGIEVLVHDDISTGNVTYEKILTTVILGKFLKYGIPRKSVKNLGLWFSKNNVIEYVLRKISAGMNVILYTDFAENFSIYSDIEFNDWIRASYLFPHPFVFISLNAVMLEIDEKYLSDDDKIFVRKKPSIFIGMSQVHETNTGKMVICSLPKQTNSIVIIPPFGETKEIADYQNMISITEPGRPVIVKLPPENNSSA
jgi:hypothetical protein